MRETRTDVAIVGGGIAGGALAVRLARAGLGVTVLGRSVEFRDRFATRPRARGALPNWRGPAC